MTGDGFRVSQRRRGGTRAHASCSKEHGKCERSSARDPRPRLALCSRPCCSSCSLWSGLKSENLKVEHVLIEYNVKEPLGFLAEVE